MYSNYKEIDDTKKSMKKGRFTAREEVPMHATGGRRQDEIGGGGGGYMFAELVDSEMMMA
jgi:hypothetical protein